MEFGPWQVFWLGCGAATVLGAVLAHRGRRWQIVGRAAVGGLFLFGGAMYNFIYLASGGDYTDFADTAHFAWVTDAWRAVVAPNQILFIGLLVAFEATVGVLILSGGGRSQLGYAGVIGFYLALWLFGGFQLVWSLSMLPFMILLLVAERRSVTPITPTRVGDRPMAGIGV